MRSVARQGLGEIRPSQFACCGKDPQPTLQAVTDEEVCPLDSEYADESRNTTQVICGLLAISLSNSFTGSSVEIQRTLWKEGGVWPHRRSPHQAQTACRTVCIVHPRLPRVPIPHVHRFFCGLGHTHRGSDSTNFSPSQSSRIARVACTGLHTDLQLLRRVLDFIFGTMKHSCHSAVSLSIADGGTDLSTASVTNPATAFDFPPLLRPHSSLPLTFP